MEEANTTRLYDHIISYIKHSKKDKIKKTEKRSVVGRGWEGRAEQQ